MDSMNSPPLFAREALQRLEKLSGVRGQVDVHTDGASITFEHEAETTTLEAIFQKRLGKERAVQIAASEGGAPGKSTIIIVERITSGAGKLLRQEGISYLDADGNCHIQSNTLFIFIKGQKSNRRPQRRQRAFQKAGLKTIYALLEDPKLIASPYRTIAKVAGVSRGAVSYVVGDLEQLGHVEQNGQKRRLVRLSSLAERWATGYGETLRPELLQGRFRFVEKERSPQEAAEIKPGMDWWGGEPAADLLTGHLRPEQFTLYTREQSLPDLLERLRAIPDPDGSLEVLNVFWTPELEGRTHWKKKDEPGVGALLVYADLLSSGASRNIEVARLIQGEHLTEQAFQKKRR